MGEGAAMRATLEPSIFVGSTTLSRDGTPLSMFVAGSRDDPALVLVNAYGIPAAIWEPLRA